MERSDRNLNPYFNNPANVNMANNWSLNRGWPLNRGSSEISIRPFKRLRYFNTKQRIKRKTEPQEDDNKPVFEFFK